MENEKLQIIERYKVFPNRWVNFLQAKTRHLTGCRKNSIIVLLCLQHTPRLTHVIIVGNKHQPNRQYLIYERHNLVLNNICWRLLYGPPPAANNDVTWCSSVCNLRENRSMGWKRMFLFLNQIWQCIPMPMHLWDRGNLICMSLQLHQSECPFWSVGYRFYSHIGRWMRLTRLSWYQLMISSMLRTRVSGHARSTVTYITTQARCV